MPTVLTSSQQTFVDITDQRKLSAYGKAVPGRAGGQSRCLRNLYSETGSRGPLPVLRHGNQTVAGTEHYARSLAPIQQRIGTEQKLRGTGSPQRLHTDRIHYPV